MDKASAADTIDLGSITGLVIPKLEKSLYSHPASRLDSSNEMGGVKLSPLSVDNLANKNVITLNLRKNFRNVSDGV